MKKVLLGTFLSLLPAVAASGPFGFSNESTPNGTHCSQMDDPMWYKCGSAPKAHPDFDYYVIQHHNELGVCFLKAVGKNIKTNSFGSQLTSQTDKIKNQISSKYGPPTKIVDQLMPGSIWNDPEDFMMSMVQKDRLFYIEWKVDASKNVFETVGITRQALGTDEGYLNVEYYYPASEKCDAVVTDNEASSF